MLPRRCTSNIPSSDLSHLGRADAPKKMRICRVTERLPRIARLPHLKTQTPRTPRTPRVKSSTTTAENKRVGRRWSPPGGLQYFLCRRPRTKLSQQVGRRLEQGWPYPPPHRGRACWTRRVKGFLLSLHLKCLHRIFFPEFCPSKLRNPSLFLSPAPRTFRRPGPR